MKIGFIGAGTVAKTIAKHVLAFEHQILLSNSRGPDTLSALVEAGLFNAAGSAVLSPLRHTCGVKQGG